MIERRTLAGRRIVVTRAGVAGEQFAEQLRAHGAEPILRPTIAIAPPCDWTPLDNALARLDGFDWLVCTSANAVAALFERLALQPAGPHRPTTLRIGAVGGATAAAFSKHGWPVDLVPAQQTAEGVVAALGSVTGHRILFPASDIASPTLSAGLQMRGALVTTAVAYRTLTVAPQPAEPLLAALRDGAVDALTFTSPSTVRGFLPLLALVPGTAIPASVCVGPVTAQAARAARLPVSAVAVDHSTAGLIDTLTTLFSDTAQAPILSTPLTQGGHR